MFPVKGKFCDITNGVIYTIRGDGINASLSFAGAVPFAGWAATGAKWAMVTVALANGKTIKLLWKSINGVIDFGKRSDLRKVLQIKDGMPVQAHHIIPWAKSTDPLVQAAAKAKNPFHMNELKNGFPLHESRHMGRHPNYDKRIVDAFEKIKLQIGQNPDPNLAAEVLRSLTERITNAIRTQADKKIDDIIF